VPFVSGLNYTQCHVTILFIYLLLFLCPLVLHSQGLKKLAKCRFVSGMVTMGTRKHLLFIEWYRLEDHETNDYTKIHTKHTLDVLPKIV